MTAPWEMGFFRWLVGGPRRKALLGWTLAGALLHAVGSISRLRSYISPEVEAFLGNRLAVVPALLHVATILLFIVAFLPDHMRLTVKSPTARTERGVAASKLLFHYWSALWIIWLFFYIFLAWRFWHWPSSTPPTGDHAMAVSIAANFANNAQTAVLFALYWELSESTFVPDGRGGYKRAEKALWPILITMVMCAAIAEFALWGHVWAKLFPTIEGVLAGVAIALFAGRLDSKRIRPPRFLIGALYFYACIQSLFAFLDDPEELGLAVFSTALLLKVAMFLLVYWVFVSGRLVYYVVRVGELMDEGERDFEEFAALHYAGEPPASAVAPPAGGKAEAAPSTAGAPGPAPAKRVFVAAPMSTVAVDARETVRQGVLAAVAAISRQRWDVYCAVGEPEPWPPASKALSTVESEMAKCDMFVFIYPEEAATSALIEAGMALALKKRCLFFLRGGTSLPFLLTDIAKKTSCHVVPFRDYKELSQRIEQHWPDYLEGVGVDVAGEAGVDH